MRSYRAFVALTFAIAAVAAVAAVAAQPAVAADRAAPHARATQGQPEQAVLDLPGPPMPVGALVFAAVGSAFLFRRRRHEAGPERD